MECIYNNHNLGNQFVFCKFGSASNALFRIQNLSGDFNNANYEYI